MYVSLKVENTPFGLFYLPLSGGLTTLYKAMEGNVYS
jgi:hypothetical protein